MTHNDKFEKWKVSLAETFLQGCQKYLSKEFWSWSRQFKSIFSDFDILVKNVASAATVASLFCFFVWRDILVFFFRRNLFLNERKLYSNAEKLATLSLERRRICADSLHTRITVFRGFQREYWSRKELKYFLSLPWRKKEAKKCERECFSSSRLKMFIARRFTPQPAPFFILG